MQFRHRISISSTTDIKNELVSFGIPVGTSELITFELDESDALWPKLQAWMAKRKPVDVVTTRFSKDELTSANWLELVPSWHHGYPQPNEDIFGYREATYDLSEFCEVCGIGKKQKAPFQLKNEPKWGRNGILQLNWIFDEYFVTPDIWAKVFERHGIGHRQVINTRGVELKTVLQLVITEKADIVGEGLTTEKCASCGRTKYVPVIRGAFPALVAEPSRNMVKTKAYFGSGASANKRIVVSQKLARALQTENVRGASVRPVARNNGVGNDCER